MQKTGSGSPDPKEKNYGELEAVSKGTSGYPKPFPESTRAYYPPQDTEGVLMYAGRFFSCQ